MSKINSCRFCQHYVPEGRRGGTCLKLQVPVQANWSACPMVNDPFVSAWDGTVPIIASHACHHSSKLHGLHEQTAVDGVVTLPLI